jgi:hypothetical protein
MGIGNKIILGAMVFHPQAIIIAIGDFASERLSTPEFLRTIIKIRF